MPMIEQMHNYILKKNDIFLYKGVNSKYFPYWNISNNIPLQNYSFPIYFKFCYVILIFSIGIISIDQNDSYETLFIIGKKGGGEFFFLVKSFEKKKML